MAEYINVEKPFLDKLCRLDWQVIDQGLAYRKILKKILYIC